jgi:hypothetical protein
MWTYARAGRIPHIRLGRYRRFREEAVEAWLVQLESGDADAGHSAPRRSPD